MHSTSRSIKDTRTHNAALFTEGANSIGVPEDVTTATATVLWSIPYKTTLLQKLEWDKFR